MTLLSLQQAPIIDNAGVLRVPSVGEQILPLNKSHTAGQYPRWKKADRFGCAPDESSDCEKCPELGEVREGYVRSCGLMLQDEDLAAFICPAHCLLVFLEGWQLLLGFLRVGAVNDF